MEGEGKDDYLVVKKPFRFLYTEKPKLYTTLVTYRGLGKTVALIQNAYKRFITERDFSCLFFSSTLANANSAFNRHFVHYETRLERDSRFYHNRARSEYSLSYGGREELDLRTIKLSTYEEPDKRRGMHARLIILDEAELMPDGMFHEIIRPMLDVHPLAQIIQFGTPMGHNDFWRNYMRGVRGEPNYASHMFTVSDGVASGLLSKEYVEELRRQYVMDGREAKFQQEYECDFDVALVEGSVYHQALYQAQLEGRIGELEYNPMLKVHSAWDLGYSDCTSVWFFQKSPGLGNPVLVIDFFEERKMYLNELLRKLEELGYPKDGYALLPHDAESHHLCAANTAYQTLSSHGYKCLTLERTSNLYNGIEGVRQILRTARFNGRRCMKGIEHLKLYHTKVDKTSGEQMYSSVHDEHSHAADAFRYLFEGKSYWDVRPVRMEEYV
jgi:hypothetical protein